MQAGRKRCAGCDYVLHVASPIPVAVPKDENELIVPAREGALRVLRAAKAAGVKRVVLTSSFAAIGYGQKPQSAPFDETSWTDIDGYGATPYIKSKTIAERAAWDFVAKEGGSGARRRQPGGRVRPGARAGLLAFDHDRSAHDGRCDSRLSAAVVRRGRRARRRGPARARDDASRRARRALPVHGRRFHVDARDREGAESAHGRGGRESAGATTAELAGAPGSACAIRR